MYKRLHNLFKSPHRSAFGGNVWKTKNGVALSCNRKSEADWRGKRLQDVCKSFKYLFPDGAPIYEMHDHKGCLLILWKNFESYQAYSLVFKFLWLGQNECRAEHYIKNDCGQVALISTNTYAYLAHTSMRSVGSRGRQ